MAPPDQPSPVITVTNPTDRLFGSFTVSKTMSGATEGILDPTAPYRMTWRCQPGTGTSLGGDLEVTPGQVRTVAFPDVQIPIDSACSVTESVDGLPALQDSAWQWQDPTFTLDGAPAPEVDRTVSFTIPSPTEDIPTPNVAVGVANTVTKTPGAYALGKSSDPASGSSVAPGSTVTYRLDVTSSGTVPVHDIVVTDDLTAVLNNAALVEGSIAAPAGTTATFDGPNRHLVWTVGTVPNGETRTLTYQITVNQSANGVTVRNVATTTGDVPPSSCAPRSGDPTCSTTHTTPTVTPPPPPVTPPEPPLPDTGFPGQTLAVAGLLAVLAGMALVLATRRRREPGQSV